MQAVPKNIIKTPGVYFFHNKSGRILYIGKAVNLKARVSSYFNKQTKDSRISKMVELASRVTWQETSSEIEALILESQLIKKHRPPFNVMLRDDKQYFFVGFTKGEFPKIFISHQLQTTNYKLPTAKFVGPFTDGGALKTTLRLLRRIFPYCTCKQLHNNYCLNYHIGKCPGFCCLKNSPELAYDGSRRSVEQVAENKSEYLKNIKAITSVLDGKRTSVLTNFKKEMLTLGKKHDFEKAIELRDKIEKLEKVFENAQILRNAASRDGISSTAGLTKLLKINHIPRRIEGYDISNIQGQFATGSMVVFVDGQPDKSQYRKFKIRQNFRTGTKGAFLKKSENLGGQVPVVGDVPMLKEVLTRRFNHPKWQYPDLIIVDGGIGQLNAAHSVIPKNIPVIALTKDNKHRGSHVYIVSSQDPILNRTTISLKKLPEPVRNLILQIDAEAHRFAISYYRKLHKSSV